MGAFCHGGFDGAGLLANLTGMNHQQSGCELTSLDPATLPRQYAMLRVKTWSHDDQLLPQSVTLMCHTKCQCKRYETVYQDGLHADCAWPAPA